MTDEEMIVQYRTGNQDVLNDIIKSFQKTLSNLCFRYRKYAEKYNLESSDLMQEGWIAFLASIDKYEIRESQEESSSFKTFAYNACEYAIQNAIKKSKPYGYKTTKDKLYINSLYQNAYGTEEDDDDSTLEDICSSDMFASADDVVEKVFCEYQHSVLDDAISNLPEKQAEIIQSKYWHGLTQKQISEQQACSESCIGEYERKALSKLRKMKKIQLLHDEVFGYDSCHAYNMSLLRALNNQTSTTEYLALKRLEYEEEQNKTNSQLKEIYQFIERADDEG